MERITRRRAFVLLGIVLAILGFYSIRLYTMQVVDAEGKENNSTTYTMWTRVRAARGDLLDANGNKLVYDKACYDLHINHYVILKTDNTNGRLLELVKLCQANGVEYIDHFPVTKEKPYAYTLDQQNSTVAWY